MEGQKKKWEGAAQKTKRTFKGIMIFFFKKCIKFTSNLQAYLIQAVSSSMPQKDWAKDPEIELAKTEEFKTICFYF